MRLIFTIIFLFTSALSSQLKAQRHWCGTDHFTNSRTEEQLKDNASFEKAYLEKLDNVLNGASKRASKYTIPVVFHVIHEGGNENVSDAALVGLINQVNQDFALQNADTTKIQSVFKDKAVDCEIEFQLAKKDPDGNCTNGITRTFSSLTNDVRDYGGNDVKSLIKWNQKKYLNVWIVKSIQSSGVGITLGYAYYPGTSPTNDGIVLRYDQTSTNSLTHEIGHYLNLIHTFEDGCFGGDRVSDTPPTAELNFGCPKGQNSCNNDSPDLIDQIENYMDYSDCDAMFTLGQKVRMHAAIEQYRSELVSDNNLVFTGTNGDEVLTKPIANFSASNTLICKGSSISFLNTGCSHTSSSNFKWEIEGPQNFNSEDETPSFKFDSVGFYDVKLTITNSKGTSTKIIDQFITVRDDVSEIISPFSTHFNNLNRVPENWNYENQNEEFEWAIHEKGLNDTKCLFVSNFNKGKPSYKTSFILPTLDISQNEDQILRYNLAYARIDENSNDALNIYVSLDCGKTWRLISTDVSKRLSTTADRSFFYVPTDESQWVEKQLDLGRYEKYNLILKFEFVSKNGNNIFIDNLRIGTEQVGLKDVYSNVGFKMFPNPVNSGELLNIEIPQDLIAKRMRIMDISGKEIFKSDVIDNNISFSTNKLKTGIYTVLIDMKNGSSHQRLIIK